MEKVQLVVEQHGERTKVGGSSQKRGEEADGFLYDHLLDRDESGALPLRTEQPAPRRGVVVAVGRERAVVARRAGGRAGGSPVAVADGAGALRGGWGPPVGRGKQRDARAARAEP